MSTEWTSAILNWNGLQGTLLEGGYEVEECLSRTDTSASFVLRILGDRFTKAIVRFFAPGGVSPEQFSIWTEACSFPPAGLSKPMGVGQIRFEGHPLQYVMFVKADETLADVLRERALSAPEVREITQTAVAALGGLHSRGYVHSGLSPETILAVGQSVVLSTAGLRRINHPLQSRSTDSSSAPRYLAPESRSENGTPEADIWCLGASVFEALTQKPYTADEMEAAFRLPSPFHAIAVCSLDEDPHGRCSLSAIRAMLRGEQLDLLEQRKAALAAKAAAAAKAEAEVRAQAEALAQAEAAAKKEAAARAEAAANDKTESQQQPSQPASTPAALGNGKGAAAAAQEPLHTAPPLTKAAAAGSNGSSFAGSPSAPSATHHGVSTKNGGSSLPASTPATPVIPQSVAAPAVSTEANTGTSRVVTDKVVDRTRTDEPGIATAKTAADTSPNAPHAPSVPGEAGTTTNKRGIAAIGKAVPSVTSSVAAVAAAAASDEMVPTAAVDRKTTRSLESRSGAGNGDKPRPRSAMPLPNSAAPLWTDAVRFSSPEELAAEMTAKRARIRIVSYVIAGLALIGCVFWLILSKPARENGSASTGTPTAASQAQSSAKQSWPARELGPANNGPASADGNSKGSSSLPPTAAGAPNSPLLSESADATSGAYWRVIAYTANKLPDAQRRAQQIAAKHPGFSPEVFSPSGNGAPYLVVLGGKLDREQALKVRGRARARGLARDAYVQNFNH